MRLFNNKKAIEMYLVYAIIILASFVVLVFLYKGLINKFSTAAQDQNCFNSALANAYTKLAGVEVAKLDCPTHYLTVKGEDLNPTRAKEQWDQVTEITERSGQRVQFTALQYNEQGYYEYAVNDLVAKEMKSCWKRLGEGRLSLFDEWLKQNAQTGSKAVCVICARLEFDNKAQEKVGKTEINSLTEWLRNNPSQQYRVGEPGRTLSMYEYVQDPDTYDPELSPSYRYALNQPLAVMFTRTNRHIFSAWFEEVRQKGWVSVKEGAGYLYDKITQKEQELAEAESREAAQKTKGESYKLQTDVRGWDMLLVVPYADVAQYCGYLAN